MGADSGVYDPYGLNFNPPPDENSGSLFPSYGNPANQQTTFLRDGMPIPTDEFMMMVNSYFASGIGFGMLESNARISNTMVGIRTFSQRYVRRTYTFEGSVQVGFSYRVGYETWHMPIYDMSSWGFSSFYVMSLQQRPAQQTPQLSSNKMAVVGAIDRIENFLKNNPNSSCAQFFGNTNDAITVLEAMKKNLQVERSSSDPTTSTLTGISQSRQTVAGGNYLLPTKFIVYSNGPFFVGGRSSAKAYAGYPAGSPMIRNLIIFHELAHDILRNGSPLIPNDDDRTPGGIERSEQNSILIRKQCEKEIFKLR